jgi:hypothetical protein
MSLYQKWLDAKKLEAAVTAERRELEDQMVKQFAVAKDFNGTMKREVEGFTVTIEGKINKKVDSEKLQQIAASAGLGDYLPTLFRWKPEINAAAWKAADQAVIAPLTLAITSTPGRPSFAITKD